MASGANNMAWSDVARDDVMQCEKGEATYGEHDEDGSTRDSFQLR